MQPTTEARRPLWRRRRVLVPLLLLALLVVGGIAWAVLIAEAPLDLSTTTGDKALEWESNEPVNLILTQVTGDGTCSASIDRSSPGKPISVTFTDVWDESECLVNGARVVGKEVLIRNPSTTSLDALGLDFSAETDYCPVGDPCAIGVEVLDAGTLLPVAFPITLAPGAEVEVEIRLLVQGANATVDTTYQSVGLGLLGG